MFGQCHAQKSICDRNPLFTRAKKKPKYTVRYRLANSQVELNKGDKMAFVYNIDDRRYSK